MSIVIGIDASRAIKKQKTGVEWYAFQVINQMIKTGQKDVRFILYCDKFRDPVPYSLCWSYGEADRALGPRIKHLRWPFKYLWTQGRLSLEILLHPPDVLFIPASAMPIIHSENTVVAIHDVGFMKFPECYGKWQKRYLKWSTRFAVRQAKAIITISEFSKREIIKYFEADDPSHPSDEHGTSEDGARSKVVVTHLAHDSERFRVINDKEHVREVVQKHNITEPFILFVGRLEKKKNVDGLVKAFAEFRKHNRELPHKLALAGSRGYSWKEIEKLIMRYNLQNEILTLGYVPDEDLPYLYNGADLFVFPSLYEGFGMPILEAMACGVPVIASDTTSCPEVAGDSAVLVNPRDTEQLAEKMAKVLSDDELKKKLVEKGLERVKMFSWEKCADKTINVLLNRIL